MTWMEFIVALIAALAWPAAVISLVLLFRRQVMGMLHATKRLKVGPAGVELERWDREAAVVAESVVADSFARSSERDDEDVVRLMAMAATAPEAAVVQSFGLVERRLRALATAAGVEGVERTPATKLVEDAVRAGAITSASAEGIRGLATLRDLAAMGWGEPATAGRAVEYVTLARALLYTLRSPPHEDG